jgi:SpoVK/Ycf46/Vps4 family AAA+-type ATPase
MKHFTVRWPLPQTLDGLFYQDVGVAAAAGRLPVSVLLQHAEPSPRTDPPKKAEQLWSLVLYGPPGTGKSTLPEALAAIVEIPLVEVTPSDIVVSGEQNVERRARHVFSALNVLTVRSSSSTNSTRS